MKSNSKSNSGFTLIELLTVLAVVALLLATLLPALARSRPNSRIGQCFNNARQLALAVQIYTTENSDLFPPNPDDGTTTPGYGWCGASAGGGIGNAGPQAHT